MIDRGVPAHQVQAMAGHQSITITMDVYKGTATTDQLSIMASMSSAMIRELEYSGFLGGDLAALSVSAFGQLFTHRSEGA